MNVVKLRHMVAVDQSGSVTAGAESLNVTQSSVTKSIAEIEATLGYRIFNRHPRGVTTTLAGRDFIDRIERILTDLDQTITEAKAGHAEESRVFRIAISPPAMQGLMGKALLKVMRLSEKTRMHIVAGTVEQNLRLLRRGDVDFLFGPAQGIRLEDQYDMVDIQPVWVDIFTRFGHPLADKDVVSDRDLAPFPFIAADMVSPSANFLQRLVQGNDQNVRNHFHIIDYFPTIMQVVRSTDAVGGVHAEYAEQSQFRDRFKILRVPGNEPLAFRVAYPKDTLKRRLIETFISGLPTGAGQTWFG